MVFVTGDCHADFSKFNMENFPDQDKLTKDDYMIICGDFGGVWNKDTESKQEKWWMDWLEEKPFTTLFVDGNHENFDRLYAYPVEEWNGGKVHKIRPSVIHLMRGQVFTLAGKTFFTFGGASSHDISSGILDTDAPDFYEIRSRLYRAGAMYRINHFSWWKEELPSEEEMEEGRKNLEAHGNKVDFIISHCCSKQIQFQLSSGWFKDDYLTEYFEELRRKVQYDKWFFGHYHEDRLVTKNDEALYLSILQIV